MINTLKYVNHVLLQHSQYDEGEKSAETVAMEKVRGLKAREILIELADEYQNDYLTPEVFAEHNGLTTLQAVKLIELAQCVRISKHPEE